jgi:CheY-like chemotaxis protein
VAEKRHITIEVDYPALGDWHVFADRQRFKQVLINLLANAIKYNHEGGQVAIGGEIVEGVKTVDREGLKPLKPSKPSEGKNASTSPPSPSTFRLFIRDNGPGISADQMPRLFQPFERLGAEHTPVEGTGLGLALCKQLVELMAGAISVESMVDHGTTAWVEMPLVSNPGGAVGHDTGFIKFPAGPGAGPKTLLYIEDNLSNIRLIEAMVANHPGIRLLVAMQGRLGLGLAHEHHPDLILLDVHLPDLAGGEVLRQLQSNRDTRAIPVVMLSADATQSQIERLLAAGARDYLTKPLDVKKFLHVVDEMLK